MTLDDEDARDVRIVVARSRAGGLFGLRGSHIVITPASIVLVLNARDATLTLDRRLGRVDGPGADAEAGGPAATAAA